MAKTDATVIKSTQRRGGLIPFFRESWHEIRRVRWPSRKEVTNYTIAALLTCIVLSLLVWGFDLGVSKLMSLVGLV